MFLKTPGIYENTQKTGGRGYYDPYSSGQRTDAEREVKDQHSQKGSGGGQQNARKRAQNKTNKGRDKAGNKKQQRERERESE